MFRFFVWQWEQETGAAEKHTSRLLKTEDRNLWNANVLCLLFYYKFQAVPWVVADISQQRTGVQIQANPCGICSGQNVSGTSMSPSTANAPVSVFLFLYCITCLLQTISTLNLVSVNPLELHIQSIICYRSYRVLAIDIYCNFPIKNIKNVHLHFGNNIQVLKYTASGMSNRKRIGFMFRAITIKYYWENIFFEISYI
jgi:hypothetical protein